MTLKDLDDHLDWSKFEEDIKENSRFALLDCALHLKSCKSATCNWKGVRGDDGQEYRCCEYCGSPIADDAEGQQVFRNRLGDVWSQAEIWMQKQGLAKQH